MILKRWWKGSRLVERRIERKRASRLFCNKISHYLPSVIEMRLNLTMCHLNGNNTIALHGSLANCAIVRRYYFAIKNPKTDFVMTLKQNGVHGFKAMVRSLSAR